MAGIKSLIAMALTGSAGIALLLLACTIEKSNWWPALVTIFYILVPLPILIAKRISSENTGFGGERNQAREWAYFITTGIVMSAYAQPLVMARTGTLIEAATILSICSSTFFFVTILSFFIVFQADSTFDGIY